MRSRSRSRRRAARPCRRLSQRTKNRREDKRRRRRRDDDDDNDDDDDDDDEKEEEEEEEEASTRSVLTRKNRGRRALHCSKGGGEEGDTPSMRDARAPSYTEGGGGGGGGGRGSVRVNSKKNDADDLARYGVRATGYSCST
jgi:hypothetical protein